MPENKIETMEDRLNQYKELKKDKNCEIICPVCFKSLVNRYSLANHVIFLIKNVKEHLNPLTCFN